MVEPAYASLTVEHLKVLTSKVHPYQRIMGVDPVGSEKSAGSGSSRLYLTLYLLLRGGATHYSYGEDRRDGVTHYSYGEGPLPMVERLRSLLVECANAP